MLAKRSSGNFTTFKRTKRHEGTAPTEKPYIAGATTSAKQRPRVVMGVR
jgi:hypothetical protein